MQTYLSVKCNVLSLAIPLKKATFFNSLYYRLLSIFHLSFSILNVLLPQSLFISILKPTIVVHFHFETEAKGDILTSMQRYKGNYVLNGRLQYPSVRFLGN